MSHAIVILALGASLAWGQKPVISPGGVVNAASYVTTRSAGFAVGQGLSGGSIVSIFGTNLAGGTAVADTIPLPLELAGTSVTFECYEAYLFYVSPTQINVQMPYSTALGGEPCIAPGSKGIIVHTAAGDSAPYYLDYAGAEGIFTRDASGCGQGAVLNVKVDGTVSINSEDNSVAPGEFITAFGTGFVLEVSRPPRDGVPAPVNPPAEATRGGGLVLDFASISLNDQNRWAGRAPGLIGVDQFNFLVPETAREGCAIPLQVTSPSPYGISQPVTIAIRKGGGRCLDPPSAGYGEITWQKTVTLGATSVGSRTEVDTVEAFLQASPGKQAPPFPTYITGRGIRNLTNVGSPCPIPGYRSLDAGSVSVQGPGFGPVRLTTTSKKDGQVGGLSVYRADLSAGTIQPGSFRVSAAGGADVGSFESSVNIGSDIQVTDALVGRFVRQDQNLTIHWTGGDSTAWVTATIVRPDASADYTSSVQVKASEGTITFQPTTVDGFGLPSGPAELIIEVTPDPSLISTISPPGLSLGGRHQWKYTYRFEGLTIK